MSYGIKITNEEIYHERVIDVELNIKWKLSDGFHGTVAVHLENDVWIEYWGTHGSHDYEDDYGFIIESKH